uniref:receptor-like protein EIX1 n=1 Tax=Erigeron canadensis TaxID=72917 RepID=UPI001CB91BC4|nr:receptor-like protein EIX1 [Erigeron canadensis]
MDTTFLVMFTFLLLQIFGTSSSYTMITTSSNVTCIKRERESLLIFKQSLIDRLNRLSTWTGVECCQWEGVGCDRRNGHVVKLDLRTPVSFTGRTVYANNWLVGEVSPSLLNLTHLLYLDLSVNNFSGDIPEFLGAFSYLEYLNLSHSGFGGVVPHRLGNLSRLQYLDLNSNNIVKDSDGVRYSFGDYSLVMDDMSWVSSLSSLKHLDLSWVSIGTDTDWFHSVNTIPSLLTLNLASCDINLPSIKFTNLTFLSSLDLSSNNIDSTIPVWLSNLTNLMHLNLKDNSFYGQIPALLGTLTHLAYVDLSENYFNTSIPDLFSNLTGLVHLDLNANQFHGSFPPDMKLCNLSFLDLSANRFEGDLLNFMGNTSDCMLNSLKYLNLGYNQFNGSIPIKFMEMKKLEHLLLLVNEFSGPIPSSRGGVSCLRELDFFYNQLNGTIPASLGRISTMEKIDLSANQLSGNMPASIGLLSRLERLDLSVNQLSGNIPASFGLLSRLEKLDLFMNQLSGNIPESIGLLPRVKKLRFNDNRLSGNIPTSFGQLSTLESLDVSNNSLVGVLSEVHFSKMNNLSVLALSSNSLSFTVSSQWEPPFQLLEFDGDFCNIGPHFPNWLQTQKNLQTLNLSNSNIKDTIPEWFEDICLSSISNLDLSHNQISGKLPAFHGSGPLSLLKMNSNKFEGSLTSFPSNVMILDLSDNLLSGHVPQINATMNPDLNILSLAKNHFTGSVPIHFCNLFSIKILDLSQNKFSGRLPSCLGNLSSLRVIDVTNNMLSGIVPDSLGFLTQLKSLHLHNNKFQGNLPFSFQNLTELVTLDLGYNSFTGIIPSWNVENLPNLRILNLQLNKFTGKVPLQLCQLHALQHLNLAQNNISGTIPHCFGNLSGMMTNQVNSGYTIDYYDENIMASTKGKQLVYTKTIQFFTSLDLSSNNFVGEIPNVLMNLVGLKNLNLSRNLLDGQIPMSIGNLNQLESLDFSMNKLSGQIPQSLSSLNFLGYLNLSFNNLSGAIPIGNQLQTLVDPSIYEGNYGLCGPPLSRSCKGNEASYNHDDEDESQDEAEALWFYSGMAPGLAVGFIGLTSSLYFIRVWRLAYFEVIENVYGWTRLLILVTLARLQRKFF